MRIDASISGQELAAVSGSELISRLSSGDVVRARVLEIAANEMVLRLSDGSKVSATTLIDIGAKVGDVIELRVKGEDNGKLLLETIKFDFEMLTKEGKDITKELIKLGISPDVKNVELASEFRESGIKISKSLMDKGLQALEQFKNIDTVKAAYLASKNLAPIEKNIEGLTRLLDQKLKIGNGLNDLLKELIDTDDPKLLQKLNEGLIKGVQAEKLNLQSKQNNPLATQNKSDPIVTTTPSVIEGEKQPIEGKNSRVEIPNTQKEKVLEAAAREFTDKMELIKKEVGLQNIKKNEVEESRLLNNNKEIIVEKDLVKTLLIGAKVDINKLSEQDIKVLKEMINGIPQKHVEQEKFIRRILQKGEMEETSKALTSNPEKSLFEQVTKELFLRIKPQLTGEDIKVKEQYKEVFSFLELVKEALGSSQVQNRDDLLSKADNLQNNMKFMNDINQNSSYIQIPITLGEKNTTGELYILKRGGKKNNINPEDATMLISLDTNSLGQVDSLVTVRKKNISVNMRVVAPKIADFIKSNSDNLYELLKERGYKLVDFKVRLRDMDVTPLTAEKMANKVSADQKAGIDIKL